MIGCNADSARNPGCQSCVVAKNFNADFYVTCATVIPVLFIAVTVQGQAYEAVLREALKTRKAGAVVESRLLQQIG